MASRPFPADNTNYAEESIPGAVTSAIIPPDEDIPDDLDDDEDILPVAIRRGNRVREDRGPAAVKAPVDEDDLFGDEPDGEEEPVEP